MIGNEISKIYRAMFCWKHPSPVRVDKHEFYENVYIVFIGEWGTPIWLTPQDFK
jgi:hypothetical protein